MKRLFLLALFCWPFTACPAPSDIATDVQSPPKSNPCAEDNGGCGDPAIFQCEDTDADTALCKYDYTEDWRALTKNVRQIDHGQSWPSTLVAYGPSSFPVVSFAESQRAFVAAARVGEGKAMHWGHDTYLQNPSAATDDSAQLLRNAIDWMGQEETPIIGVPPGMTNLASFFGQLNFPVVDVAPSDVAIVDIYITEIDDDWSQADQEHLQAFVREGKGLITAGHAWWWRYENPEPLEEFSGNQILKGTGIFIGDDFGEPGAHAVPEEPPSPLFQATLGLAALDAHQQETAPLPQEEIAMAANTVAHAITHLPLSETDYFDAVAAFVDTLNFPPITPQDPLIPEQDPLRLLASRAESKWAQHDLVTHVMAHPSASAFPGPLTDGAQPVDHTVMVNATYTGRSSDYMYSGPNEPRWESTGYYAAAGQSVRVTVGEDVAGEGLDLLIGSHTDQLWEKETIDRFPQVTRSFPIESSITEIRSAFGGLIYVRIPGGSALGDLTVSLSGGYLAPLYVHGETTVTDWQNTIRQYPAPWAELASDKFILTFPADLARTLDNPDEIMDFWDEIMDSSADLEGIPHERARPERFVLDQQISLGWMHSGYPLMAFTIAHQEFIDLDYIFTESIWGPIHEIGHNHQHRHWLLPGTTETSCNLWSTYLTETVLEMSLDDNETLAAPAREERITNYLAGGPNFEEDWNVWVALDTYLQLKERFGWDFYKTLFTLYRSLDDHEIPYTDQARIDLWVIKSSEVAGYDLSEFYLAWGLPITPSAIEEVQHLPDWDDHPMLDYD